MIILYETKNSCVRFWTWLWGTAGLFLATPLTVCLVVMGKYIPQLAFLNVALGDQPVLQSSERFYQRLLTNDPDGAQLLLDEHLAASSVLELSDAVLLPTLRFIEHDHDRGAFDGARRDALVARVDELVDDLPESAVPAVADAGAPNPEVRLAVMCLPAADAADEVAAHLLARFARPAGIDVSVTSIANLKGEMVELAVQRTRPTSSSSRRRRRMRFFRRATSAKNCAAVLRRRRSWSGCGAPKAI